MFTGMKCCCLSVTLKVLYINIMPRQWHNSERLWQYTFCQFTVVALFCWALFWYEFKSHKGSILTSYHIWGYLISYLILITQPLNNIMTNAKAVHLSRNLPTSIVTKVGTRMCVTLSLSYTIFYWKVMGVLSYCFQGILIRSVPGIMFV